MNENPIFTIGYGSRSLTDLLELLRGQRIEYLLDVRSRPYSKGRPEYAKAALEECLKNKGIRYLFMGDALGGMAEDQESGVPAQERPAFRQGIARLCKAHQQQLRVALLCGEARPELCHRAVLIGAALAELGIPVLHIDENTVLVPQEQVMDRLSALSGQEAGRGEERAADLAPDDDFIFPDMPDNDVPPPSDADMPQDVMGDEPEADSGLPGWAGSEGQAGVSDPRRPVLDLSRFRNSDPQTVLKQVFGYDGFRPLQAEVIAAVLAKEDALAIMPTGSGKSLCFQLPALLFPGLTVVVSPLIALMEDQVMQARELGLPAAFLNSTVPIQEYQAIMADVRAGGVKLLYAAPETLLQPVILQLLESVAVDCLTIDEAHCISEWGHDFRPEYRRLVDVRRRLPGAVCLAVTATATELVRRDIKASLGIDDAHQYLASFNRENLYLEVAAKNDAMDQSLAFLEDRRDQSGIIYCATRKQVDVLCEVLCARGVSALPYHAGLDAPTRMGNQRRFIRDDVRVMVATIAFGMGINKSNIRFVLHYDLPKNLESYYQQVGRAGRDGLRAECLLLFTHGDVQTYVSFIKKMDAAQQKPARLQLEAMVGYSESAVCRRIPLLGYFNESHPAANCGMCDNCCTEPKELSDVTVAAQKFLSCVKRTGEMFGMSHIIDVLRGSRSEKVLSRRHDGLSTYGIGMEHSKKQWQHLARQFIQQGLLIQDMEHGGLRLGQEAYQVFKGRQVMGVLPEPATPAFSSSGPSAMHDQAYDAQLFDLLRVRRKELAEAANVPPYVVFSDRSLVEMAAVFPQSPGTFAAIHGVGEAKLTKYADEFLPIIRDYCTQRGIVEQPAVAAPPPRPKPEGLGPRTLEVLALCESGQSIAQVCEMFKVKPATIVNHLWQAVMAGRSVRRDVLEAEITLPPDIRQRVLDAFAEHGPERLRPVYDALQGAVNYDDLHLMRLYVVLNRQGVVS
ncbi:ATP-dependent DNA helicase RecQ [Desulfonatronum thiosulfatophilum]|uniref:DNA helicase RecQ n=1 Tax=Desulfonatronum thiosulfatophilum TaxID=617002 RepID=A0A1G6D544_9BACT|nr:DNA helicase RecQ [Desulfonatronum thiosulfatophilum]SDB40179.1 ATP-dependent DNA helicase RecQ [Desulfonatronum thiosulfatophilum]